MAIELPALPADGILWSILKVLAVFVAAWVLNGALQRHLRRASGRRLVPIPERVQHQARQLVRFAIFGAAAVVALYVSELPVNDLVTSLGIVAVLTAFLANQLFANLIAGVVLVLDRPFGVGDHLDMVHLPANVQGPFEVLDVGLRTTKLASKEGVIVVPNVWFLVNPFVNRSSHVRDVRAEVAAAEGSTDAPPRAA